MSLSKRNTSDNEDLPLDNEKPQVTDDDDYMAEIGDDAYINDGLETNKELERAEATLDIVKKIVAHDRYANSTVVTIRQITDVRYEKAEEEDEE